MSRILVTGGAGYLGTVLTQELLSQAHDVTVLDRFRHGVPSLVHMAWSADLQIINGDVRDTQLLRRLLDKADAVIHLAAIVGAPACDADQAEAIDVNQHATEHLVALLRSSRNNTPLIFPCTNSGYGRGGVQPCTEDDPMEPLSLYGRTKVAAERAVLGYRRGVSLRLATLYGPSTRMRLDLLVNDFVYRAVRDGYISLFEPHYRRCVLHVRDAARAISAALNSMGACAGLTWNVGAENVTKAELCEQIKAQHAGFSWGVVEGRDPDQRDYAVSSDRFRTASGWAPRTPLDSGIAQLLRLYNMPFDGPTWRNA